MKANNPQISKRYHAQQAATVTVHQSDIAHAQIKYTSCPDSIETKIKSIIAQSYQSSNIAQRPMCLTPTSRGPLKEFPLLPQQSGKYKGRKTLVLDLDETLVHSSFQYIDNADIILPVNIEDQIVYIFVLKRPGLDTFLKTVSKLFEVVIFTASLSNVFALLVC